MLTDKPTGQTPEWGGNNGVAPTVFFGCVEGDRLHRSMESDIHTDISTWIFTESDMHIVSKQVSEVIWQMDASRRAAAFAHSL